MIIVYDEVAILIAFLVGFAVGALASVALIALVTAQVEDY